MNEFKKYFLLRVIISTVFGVGLGFFLLFLRPFSGEIFEILIIAVGLMTAVMNLRPLFQSLREIKNSGEWVNLLLWLAAVLLGVALMLLRENFLLLLLGIYSIALPVLRIALVADHRKQAKREFPRIFLGLAALIVFLCDAAELVFFVGAIACFGSSAFYLLYNLLLLKFKYGTPKRK